VRVKRNTNVGKIWKCAAHINNCLKGYFTTHHITHNQIWSLYHILELLKIFSVNIDFTRRLQSELLTALLINT